VTTKDALVIKRGEGERVPLGGADVIFKIDGETTGGAFSICETTAESGRLIPPHLFVGLLRLGVLIRLADQRLEPALRGERRLRTLPMGD